MKTDSRQAHKRTGQNAASTPKLPLDWIALISLALYMAASSLLILRMKQVQDQGFTCTFALMSLGSIASSVVTLAALPLGLAKLHHPLSKRLVLRQIAPISVCALAAMYLGQTATLYLSLSFSQICRSFTPAATLLVLLAFGLEKSSRNLWLAIFFIIAGSLLSTAVETGLPSFSLYGLTLFIFSSLFEAARIALSQALLQPLGLSPFESILYTSPAISFLLLLGSFSFERNQLAATLPLVAQDPYLYIQISLLGAITNIASFSCLKRVSGLTMKIAVCARNLVVVWFAMTRHGDKVPIMSIVGYCLSVVGFLIYATRKSGEKEPGKRVRSTSTRKKTS